MKIKLSLFLLILLQGVQAQQLVQYSLYMLNPYAFNAAVAGTEGSLIATGVYRQQWSGLKGAPLSQEINAHLPLFKINSGVGLRAENATIGAHQSTAATLSYSYHLEFGRNNQLSLGIGGGYFQYSLDGNKLRAPQGTYVEPGFQIDHNDPYLPEGKVVAGTPVAEGGILLKLKNYYLGAAVQPVFAPSIHTTKNGGLRLTPARHYVISMRYAWELNNDVLIQPSLLVKSDKTETQAEISCLARWKENIFAGTSFRGIGKKSKDALVIFGGFKLNEKTTLAYAFDVSLSQISVSNRGSHELLLRFDLNKPIGAGKLPPVIYNPRFL
ncbi:MAG: PorP/SprF family type IX secretion system membrane protein [Bacteroidetes bacterium]|nr:PorP/SprF family type IX secretion system membrane protein [Bacteroidota bacterium]